MSLLAKTCIYCVFGSVLGALGSKIKEVMTSELAIFNRMVQIVTEARGNPGCQQLLQRAKGVVENC